MCFWDSQGLVANFEIGIRVQGIESVDKVWLTCCALHNWLLEIDGLDAGWQSQILPVPSEWEGDLVEVDCEGLPQMSYS